MKKFVRKYSNNFKEIYADLCDENFISPVWQWCKVEVIKSFTDEHLISAAVEGFAFPVTIYIKRILMRSAR